jgi:nicotinamide phosphoribosyltransferase
MEISMLRNKLLAADTYKLSHFLQYPPGTTRISSYIEARGVDKEFPLTNELVNSGFQAYRKEYLDEPVTRAEVEEAHFIAKLTGVEFNRAGFDNLINKFGGHYPMRFQALPEGIVFPMGVPQVQAVNTADGFEWLTSYLETQALRGMWFPTAVATLSREMKKVFKHFLLLSADDLSMIDFMLHDFGARGVSSGESAGLGGMGHLINFKGTDTLEAIKLIRDWYSSDPNYMPGFSVNAAEHSTITAWLHFGGETEAYRNMIRRFAGEGKLYACVSDSYDIYNAVENIWGGTLKGEVLKAGGRLVVRPDSGVPEDVVLNVVEILGAKFGFTVNSKGYKVLHPSVRVIQGDGVNYQSIIRILEKLVEAGWSAENVVFGMGGALLQKVNRDSLKYAMKASALQNNGFWYDIYKDPVTDKGKRSKRGRLAVTPEFKVVPEATYTGQNLLETVWSNDGTAIIPKWVDFETVRARASV